MKGYLTGSETRDFIMRKNKYGEKRNVLKLVEDKGQKLIYKSAS